MRPNLGYEIAGRYRLESFIASGGMGEVWVAHDTFLARDVAAKILKDEYSGDPGFLERFRREARNNAALSHEGIAALFDSGEDSGSGYLIMELVPGEPLSAILERDSTVPTERTLQILAATARALHAAHVAGVIHRDVKPGNILIRPDGAVKITDFGISKLVGTEQLTMDGMVMGTAQYLAPEMAVGNKASKLSDLYSLGIVGYEMLAGQRPFTGTNALDIALAHVDGVVPPLPDDVPQDVANVIMRLLEKDPQARPRSGAALARTLDEILAGGTRADRPSVSQGRTPSADRFDPDARLTPSWPAVAAVSATPPAIAPEVPAARRRAERDDPRETRVPHRTTETISTTSSRYVTQHAARRNGHPRMIWVSTGVTVIVLAVLLLALAGRM